MNKITQKSVLLRHKFVSWQQELVALIRLAVPMTLNKLAFMAILTTDTVMMGWLGSKVLAAGALAGHFFGFVILFSIGLLSALAPIFSQHLGAQRFEDIPGTFRQGIWIALIVTIPSYAIIWQTESILLFLGQDAQLAAAGQPYLRIMLIGFIASQWRLVFNFLLAAHGRPNVNLVITVIGVGLNGIANYALMFGHFGFPKLGLDGAGIASAFVMVTLFLCTSIYVLNDKQMKRYRLLSNFWRSDWSQFFEIIRVGLPIAVTELAEISLFFAAILFVGLLGTDAVSAHAIAIQSCVIVVMVAVGISQAATVRVGYAIGAGKPLDAIRICWIAVILSSVFSIFPALLFLFFGKTIVGFYLNVSDPAASMTVGLAVTFLALGGLFQIVDFAQVVVRGVLQGIKDTRWPMFVAIGAYWGVGIPLMAFFTLVLELGGQYIWISLVVALSVIAAFLVYRLHRQFQRLHLSAQ